MYQIVEPLAYYISELKCLNHGHTIGRFGKPTALASPWQNGFAAEGENPGRRWERLRRASGSCPAGGLPRRG